MGLTDIYPFINIRRNHGLEHATIHVLSERVPHLSLVGRSDMGGFTLYGNVSTNVVTDAAHEALRRLRAGHADLAVHPRCGTILATTGILSGLASFAAISFGGKPGKRFRWGAVPQTIMAATVAAILSQPLGLLLQERYTVTGNPASLEITGITRTKNSQMTVHRVSTRQ